MTGIVNVLDVVEAVPVLISITVFDSTQVTGNSIPNSSTLCVLSVAGEVSSGNEVGAEVVGVNSSCDFSMTSGNILSPSSANEYFVSIEYKALSDEDYIVAKVSCPAEFKQRIVFTGIIRPD